MIRRTANESSASSRPPPSSGYGFPEESFLAGMRAEART